MRLNKCEAVEAWLPGIMSIGASQPARDVELPSLASSRLVGMCQSCCAPIHLALACRVSRPVYWTQSGRQDAGSCAHCDACDRPSRSVKRQAWQASLAALQSREPPAPQLLQRRHGTNLTRLDQLMSTQRFESASCKSWSQPARAGVCLAAAMWMRCAGEGREAPAESDPSRHRSAPEARSGEALRGACDAHVAQLAGQLYITCPDRPRHRRPARFIPGPTPVLSPGVTTEARTRSALRARPQAETARYAHLASGRRGSAGRACRPRRRATVAGAPRPSAQRWQRGRRD